MKIFYVIGSLELGGTERHLFQIATELKQRGYEPEIFVLQISGPLIEPLKEHGIPVYGLALWPVVLQILRHRRLIAWVQLISAAFLLWTLYWRRRPQVTHFFLPTAYLVGGGVSLFGPRMLRIMSRRSLNDYQKGHSVFAAIERWLHPRMDLICGNSRAVVAQLGDEGVHAECERLIYNGIEFSPDFAASHRVEMRIALGVPADALVLSIVANLIPYKGHADLIDALASIADDLPTQWRLLCLGRDDGIGDSLLQRAALAGIGDNILWLGSRCDVPRILSASDIGLLVSHQEGFSNAVLEAMAAGLPMVVTDVGGNGEAVVDGETGYVVPARDPRVLGAAILRMAHNPQRHLMGERGKERIKQHFTLDACVDAYERMYEEVLAQRC